MTTPRADHLLTAFLESLPIRTLDPDVFDAAALRRARESLPARYVTLAGGGTVPRDPAPRPGMVWVEEPYPRWVATEDLEDDTRGLEELLSGAGLPEGEVWPAPETTAIMADRLSTTIAVWTGAVIACMVGFVACSVLLFVGNVVRRTRGGQTR